jgi:putative DNA-invertase from lambdoid prophage Rac
LADYSYWPRTLEILGRAVQRVKAVIYTRVSTWDQDCEVQSRELHEYCQRRGWEIIHEYRDHAISGSKKNRPQLDNLMKAASLREFDAVLVWKLDRFGRSVINLNQGINDLKSYGIRFLAVSQNLDTDNSNPTAGLLLNILAAMAEFELELIRERTISGVAAAKAAGKVLGRPAKVFRRDEAIRMRQEGMSYRAIAKTLHVAPTTIVETVKGERSARATRKGVRKSPSVQSTLPVANLV